ncbi:MAG: methyltransferase [Bacteroidota bacterium]|nr:methyltransferase [Bacteroidota bacterium]
MGYKETHKKRFQISLEFFKKHIPEASSVLDLGVKNPLSDLLAAEGFKVENTRGENLDDDFQAYLDPGVDVVTAFEIFEHMLAPYNILKEIKADKLVASVPLKLWFAEAFWIENDDFKKHYHEFEKKQFDFLLRRSGWIIKDARTWKSASWSKIGIRPLLRHFFPRYYIVYCERK